MLGPTWVSRFGKRTCKPNSVVCGHSSRRRVAADTHQRPTRRFRHCMEQPLKALRRAKSRLNASGRCAAPPGSWRALPSLFGLAPCGVYPAPALPAGAVRSYRTISPLPRRDWPSRRTWSSPSGGPPERGVAEAVSFLWHWPSTGLKPTSRTLSGTLPCGVRTFLPRRLRLREAAGSDRPVLLPVVSLPHVWVHGPCVSGIRQSP
jgi:hypothetical protein